MCIFWISRIEISKSYNYMNFIYFTFLFLNCFPLKLSKNIHQAVYVSSITQSCPTLRPHEQQHAKLPCSSLTPRACSNSCPSHPLTYPSLPAFFSNIRVFSKESVHHIRWPKYWSQLFAWGNQSTGVLALASVLPMNTQDWSPLGWTG